MARDATCLLPPTVVGPADVAQLQRRLSDYIELAHQAQLRQKNGSEASLPQPPRSLSDFAATNNADLGKSDSRDALLKQLQTTLDSAPVITMSFAADPSAAFMAKIITWFRANIDPLVLVRTGLQPNIAAGCTVRTSSKVYDFSLRSRFNQQRPMLLEHLRASGKPPVAEVTIKTPPAAEKVAA